MLTIEQLDQREALYQEMFRRLRSNQRVSHIIGSDWGLRVGATAQQIEQHAHDLFVKRYGDLEKYPMHVSCGYSYR